MRKFGSYFLIVLVIFAVFAYLTWFPSPLEPPYKLIKIWGEKGTASGQFNDPTGIVVSEDHVFVSDARNSRIQVFDFDGHFQYEIGTSGSEAERLQRPMNLGIHDAKLYVTDYWSDQLKIYSLGGKFINSIGKPGTGSGEFNSPGGIAIDSKSNLYIADFLNQRIQKLTPQGKFIRQWGQTGKTGILSGQFNYPTDTAIDADDNLYIADGYNDRVQVISPEGEIVHKWGGPFAINIFGPFNGWFATVTGIAIGPEGNVFVADFYNGRIQKFSSGGIFLNVFGINSAESAHTAIAVAVAHDGSVFVADYTNNQVQKWVQDEK